MGLLAMAKSIVQIVPATLEHAQALVPHVRQADIDEFYAVNLSTPEEVLASGINLSTKSWAAIFNGEVASPSYPAVLASLVSWLRCF